MDDQRELELARSAAAGNGDAKEAFVRAHYDGIHRLARHLSQSQVDAADLAQLTFLQACRHIGRFDGRSSMRSWLAGILFHEYSHWRRGRRYFEQVRERLSPDPTERILDREILLDAIRGLGRKHSNVFILVEIHGFSVAEASTALEIPEGTVKSRLSESRVQLRRRLGVLDSPETLPTEAPL